MFFKILIFSDVPYSRGGSLLYSPTWITAEEICAAEPVLEYVRPYERKHLCVWNRKNRREAAKFFWGLNRREAAKIFPRV